MPGNPGLTASWTRWVWLLALAAGCGGGGQAGPADGGGLGRADAAADAGTIDTGTPDAGMSDTAVPDPTVALFDPTHMVQVRIDLAPGDWNQLRQQTRNLFDLLSGDCGAAPFPSPFTYFTGTVTVDGQTLSSVGVKKKGFIGSLSTEKPSLKLSFDHVIKGQRVSGMDGITLNNAKQDPAFVRQCLGYAAFARAGIPAPRCNFAHVVVNNVDLGLYVHVEGIDKDLVRRHFTDAGGNLYEGTLSDFTPATLATFDLKTNQTANDRSDLAAVAAALTASDADLIARLEPLVNLDEFFDYWAMESVVRQWDGYADNTNNFFVYDDPTSKRLHFIPWGIDGVMDPAGGGTDKAAQIAVMMTAELTRRLYAIPATRTRYLERIRALLDVAFKDTDVLPELDRMQTLILPVVGASQATSLRAAIEVVRGFVRGRRAAVLAELASPPPVTTTPHALPCLKPIGTISGTFATTWDTLAAVNPFTTGSGTLAATINGVPSPIDLVGATAGLDTSGTNGPRAGVNVVVHLTDGTYAVAILRMVPDEYAPNVTLPFDLDATVGIIASFAGTTATPVALVGKGGLSLMSAGMTAGAAVSGNLSAELLAWPF